MINKRRNDKSQAVKSNRSGTVGFFIFLVVVLLIAFGGFLNASSKSTYCAKCHVMEPYAVSWSESEHAKVQCVKCHYKPGGRNSLDAQFIGVRMYLKSITQPYAIRPFAVVSDASCSTANCHPDSSSMGPIEYKTVKFSHAKHLEGKRRGKSLVCLSCHSKIVHGERRKSTPETCFLCHLRPVEGETLESSYTAKCTFCHDIPADVITYNGLEISHTDEIVAKVECVTCHNLITSGDGKAADDRCLKCHAEKTVSSQMVDIENLHTKHVEERSIVCSTCHNEITHGMQSLENPGLANCESCHPRHHEAESLMYNTHSFGEGEDFASPEFVSHIECKACHIQQVGDRLDPRGVTFLASAESCNNCHKPVYGTLVDKSEQAINGLIQEIRTEVHITRPKVAESSFSAKDKEDMKSVLDDIEQKMLLIERGKSVHNLQYSDTLIRRSHDRINQVVAKLGGKAYKSDRIEAYRTAAQQNCNQCHYGIADFSTTFGAIAFSHLPHLADGKLQCTSCHEFTSKWQAHGNLKFQNADGCKTCHGTNGGCRSCHTGFENTKLPVFDTEFIHTPHLALEGNTCLTCHNQDSPDKKHGAIKLTGSGECTECHHKPDQTLACNDCHRIQASLMNGRIPDYQATVKGFHDFSCEKCHDMSQPHSKTLIGRKCAECHDGTYASKIDAWSSEASEKMNRLSNMIGRAETLDLTEEQKTQLHSIKARNAYLVKEKVPGIHNPNIWKRIIDEDIKKLQEWLE
jgi:hypothetical protein